MHFARKILKILFDFLCPFVAHDRETAVLRLFGKWKQKKTDSRSVVPFGKGTPQGIPPPANGKVIDTNHPWLGFPVISVRVHGFSLSTPSLSKIANAAW